MPDLAEIELEAREVLAPFGDPACRATWAARSAALRPRPDDYARIFIGRATAGMRDHFEHVWARAPVISPGSEQTKLDVSVAWSQQVATAASWPTAYRRLAEYLVADVPWARARFHRVNHSRGRAFDGLVRVVDRWVWLPTPWEAVAVATASPWVE